jgi:DNA-damage-inducible protein J
MNKSVIISARVDPKLKQESEKVLKSLGLSTTQAITLYLKQITLRHGLPFAVALPNTTTAKAIEAALAGVDLSPAESVDSLFSELGV